MKYDLDFSQLERKDHSSIFRALPIDIEEILQATLPETAARIEGAIKFCWHILGTEETLHAKEPKATRLREAFLRASLAEFVSTEETLQRDLNKLDETLQPAKIFNCRNPLFHLIRELRNLEIHLVSSKLTPSAKAIIYREQNNEITIWTIPDLTVEKFKMLRNSKNYKDEDVEEMVSWFNKAQFDWGVDDLLFRSICDLATKLIDTYSLENYRYKREND